MAKNQVQVIKSKSNLAPMTMVTPEVETKEVQSGNRRDLKSLPERIAESPIFTRNWKVPHAAELFPNDVDGRFVDYYFPYARGGALLMDLIREAGDEEKFKAKGTILKRAKLRYLIVDPKRDFADIMTELEVLK